VVVLHRELVDGQAADGQLANVELADVSPADCETADRKRADRTGTDREGSNGKRAQRTRARGRRPGPAGAATACHRAAPRALDHSALWARFSTCSFPLTLFEPIPVAD
jgi:hypothetical protein